MTSPPARTHHRHGEAPSGLGPGSSLPRSFANSDRSIERSGPRYDRKFKPLALGQNQTAPDMLDMDSTIKPLYGHQEGAEVGYNPHKSGRPSHCYHTYMLSSLRLVLRVDALPGNEHNVAHATKGLWALLDHLGPGRQPTLLRGDKSWGIEAVMARAERDG